MKVRQVLFGAVVWAAGAVALAQVPASGFYGGVTLRDRDGSESGTAKFGKLPAAWATTGTAAAEDGQRTLLFGGYRWRNDVAVEASFNARDVLSLAAGAPSLGLALSEPASRAWNVDLYTSWEMRPAMSLYGRLGYGQTEPRALVGVPASVPDPRRPAREGMNYGVGLRFDLTQSLGLRMEYSRFGRQSVAGFGESVGSSGLPESDQLSIGVQFRF